LRLFLIVFVILTADLYTKALIQENFLLYHPVPVIEGFLNITYVENPGAAFGIMADMDPMARSIFFGVVSVLAITIVLYIYFKHPENSNLIRNASALILGGAIGNMTDRVRFGKVVDFIDIYWGQYHWPAFNIADMAISIGVGLFLLDMFVDKKKTNKVSQTPPVNIDIIKEHKE
jgi:signal peptidase II